MQEMLPAVQEAKERHDEGHHPPLSEENLDDIFEAFSIVSTVSAAL